MAKVEKSAMHDFQDSQIVTELNLDQNFELLRVAQNETDDKAVNATNKVAEFQIDVNEMKAVVDNRAIRIREYFTATEGQTLFNLVKGSYETGKDLLDVVIGISPQFDEGHGITETSSTSFTLDQGVAAGTLVTATYYMSTKPLSVGHKNQHKKGAVDELNISEMAGYDELNAAIDAKITPVSEKLDGVMYNDIPLIKLQLEARNDISNGETFGTNGAVTFGMSIGDKSAVAPSQTNPGSFIVVSDLGTLAMGDKLTIYDDVNIERFSITAIDVPTKTITVSPALTKTYKAGAYIKSTMTLQSKFMKGFIMEGWKTSTTYSVTQIPLSDTTLAEGSHTLSQNSFIWLEGGYCVAAVTSGSSHARRNVHIWYRKDTGSEYSLSATVEMSAPAIPTGDSGIMYHLIPLGNRHFGLAFSAHDKVKFRIYEVGNGAYLSEDIIADVQYSTLSGMYVSFVEGVLYTTISGYIVGGSSTRYSLEFFEARLNVNQRFEITSSETIITNTTSASAENVHHQIVNGRPYVFGMGSGLSGVKCYARTDSGAWFTTTVDTQYGDKLTSYLDSNNRLWVGYQVDGATASVRTAYCTVTGKDAYLTWSFNVLNLLSGSSSYMNYPQLIEQGNDILVYYAGEADPAASVARAMNYRPINKTTFALGSAVACVHAAIHGDYCIISLPKGSTITTLTSPPLLGKLSGTTVIRTMAGSFSTTKEVGLPSDNDIRLNIGTHKEVIIYVYHGSNISVNGYVNEQAMTKKTETGVTQLKYFVSTAEGMVVRVTLTRSVVDSIGYMNNIVGGYE